MESLEVITNSTEKVNITRRSKKVKNLEQEVEMILAQDDSRDGEVQLPKTPSTASNQLSRPEDARTPRTSEVKVLKDLVQTPRRSCRKSIKPAQDYDDIVKKSMRSVTRSSRMNLMSFNEENQENVEGQEADLDQTITWSTAQVGKSSTKRKRKSRRNTAATAKIEKHDIIVGGDGAEEKDRLDDVEGATALEESTGVLNNRQRKLNMDSVGVKTDEMLQENTVEISTEKSYISAEIPPDDVQQVPHAVLQSVPKECERNFEQISVRKSSEKEQRENITEGVSQSDFPETVIEAEGPSETIDLQLLEVEGGAGMSGKETAGAKTKQQSEDREKEDQRMGAISKKEESEKDGGVEAQQIKADNRQNDNLEKLQAEFKEEDPEDHIILIQEDSEDFKELPMNSQEQEINKEEHSPGNVNIKEKKENVTEDDIDSLNGSFGCYLKSKEMSVSDLGLIPLKDDETEEAADNTNDAKDSNENTNAQAEEMPSLIVCDEEEGGPEQFIEKATESEYQQKFNETFEADKEEKQQQDQKKHMPGVTQREPKCRNSYEPFDGIEDNSLQSFLRNEAAADDEMETLKLSDDEETPRKVPRVVLTTTDQQNCTLLLTPKQPSTPKHSAKPYRFPTPYRNKNNPKEPVSSAKKLRLPQNNTGHALTTLEPREIVLRGIRKRSLSVCLGIESYNGISAAAGGGSANKMQRPLKGPLATHRQQKAVNFYSPANQTTIIDDIDRIIAESVKEDSKGKEIPQYTNVTKRRKRSFSFDESVMSKSMATKLPRPVNSIVSQSTSITTSSSKSSSSTSSAAKLTRTKLPNFAAIHQKQFQKMENLVDHITRKQERSKVLISSASKIRSASAQKNVSDKSNTTGEKPNALKKIDLGASTQVKNEPVKKPSSGIKTAPKVGNTNAPNKTTKENYSFIESNLPNPKTGILMNKHQQYLFKQQHLKPTQTFSMSSKPSSSSSSSNTPLKHQKPAFNLSTQLGKPIATIRPQPKPATTTTKTASSSSLSALSNQDKMASRLQRHMELFKGRVPTARAGVSRKIDATIRGVRSNRRFDLQMQHRKNLEN